jgi:adenylate cyclase
MPMTLSRWTRGQLRVIAAVAAIGAVIGIINSWLLSQIGRYPYDFAEFENAVRNGLTVGGALAALDLLYVQARPGAWLRRQGFARGILIRAALFTTVIIVVFALNRAIYGWLHGFERAGLHYFGLPLLRDTGFTFVVFLAISAILQMRRVIGGRTLTNLLLGRYHQSVREERVFLLVDIKGSTPMAERLGDERAHAVITTVFFDLDRPILEHGGEIYSYVGDELIASWPLEDGIRDARCLRCALAIRATLARRAQQYRATFGLLPEVRIVLHAGPVVIGECGDAKLQIVYLGDTLNTAARIEQAARGELGRDWLISGSLLERLRLMAGLRAEPIGPTPLRGRQQRLALYALEPADRPGGGAAGAGSAADRRDRLPAAPLLHVERD